VLHKKNLAARLNVQGIDIYSPMISKAESQTREILDFEIQGVAEGFSGSNRRTI